MSVRFAQQAVGGRLRPQIRKIVVDRLTARAGETGLAIDAEDWADDTTRIVMGELEVEPSGEIERLALGVVDGILKDARQEVNGDLVLDLLLLHRYNRGEEATLSPQVASRISWMEKHSRRGRRRRRRR